MGKPISPACPGPNSPSPSIDKVSKNSWRDGTEMGKTDPNTILKEKYNQQDIKAPISKS